MTKCDYCGFISETPKGYKKRFCDSCVCDKEVGVPIAVDTEYVTDYGNVSVKRLKEMERREILPDNRTDGGGYYLGRRDECGRITDRTPSY